LNRRADDCSNQSRAVDGESKKNVWSFKGAPGVYGNHTITQRFRIGSKLVVVVGVE
jgi:hypothetical protein